MSNDKGIEAKALWRSQPTEVPTMSIQYLRHRADELERSFRARNWLEQCGAAVAMAGCAIAIFGAPSIWMKGSVALLLFGIAYAWLQWRRRALPQAIETFESADAGATFYRRELERKRDMHRGIWRWYLLPMVPGIAAILAWGFLGDPHTKGTSVPWEITAIVLGWIVIALVYERFKAAQYQREIDALGTME